jgi:hypothetical protein
MGGAYADVPSRAFVTVGPSNLAQVITLLTCFRKVPGSKLYRNTDYPEILCGFFAFSNLSSWMFLKLNLECSRPHHFQLIYHYHPTIRIHIARVPTSIDK